LKNVNDYKVAITTGQYLTAPLEQRLMVRDLFGENVEYSFEIYFHWYNMIHELGHAVFEYNCVKRPHPVAEEQLVNNFAVAFWRYYGEVEMLKILGSLVKETLNRFTVPSMNNKDHLSYAYEQWGTEELYRFNNYGWFQFSCVEYSLSNPKSLEQALIDMGLTHIQCDKKILLKYDVDDRMPFKVIEDAKEVLSHWGILLPDEVSVILSDDLNCHNCQSIHR
jgi:hypothetical protein